MKRSGQRIWGRLFGVGWLGLRGWSWRSGRVRGCSMGKVLDGRSLGLGGRFWDRRWTRPRWDPVVVGFLDLLLV